MGPFKNILEFKNAYRWYKNIVDHTKIEIQIVEENTKPWHARINRFTKFGPRGGCGNEAQIYVDEAYAMPKPIGKTKKNYKNIQQTLRISAR